MEPSGIGREQPNQAKIEARHYIDELLAANQTLPSHARSHGGGAFGSLILMLQRS